MNNTLKIFLSFILSVGLNLLAIKILDSLGVHLNIEAPGGETDFSLRAGMFFFGALPALGILSALEARSAKIFRTLFLFSLKNFALTVSILFLLSKMSWNSIHPNWVVGLTFGLWIIGIFVGSFSNLRNGGPERSRTSDL